MFNAQVMKEKSDKAKINQLFKDVNDENKVTEIISVMMEDIEDNAREDIDYADFELTEDVFTDYKEYIDEILDIFKSRGYLAFISNATTLRIAYDTLLKKDDSSHISELHKSIVPQMETIHRLMPQTFHNQALAIIEELKISISEVANKGGYEYRTNNFGFNEYIDDTPSVQSKVKEKLKDLGFLVESEFVSSDYGHELVIRW